MKTMYFLIIYILTCIHAFKFVYEKTTPSVGLYTRQQCRRLNVHLLYKANVHPIQLLTETVLGHDDHVNSIMVNHVNSLFRQWRIISRLLQLCNLQRMEKRSQERMLT